mgnify:CR=1 FL=1
MNTRKVTQSFPSVCIPSTTGGLPIEVCLIAQLAPGSGSHLYATATARQQAHANFIDALDEPSTKLNGSDFSKGDMSALYSFGVGQHGHPFHQHSGQRMFTAIAGSSGAQLRFSTASAAQLAENPQAFLDALHIINLPADSLFTVRFGGGTWHQFVPLQVDSGHPALFALSCHINELGGVQDEAEQAKIIANQASIPSLTHTLPANVLALLQSATPAHSNTIDLSLHVPSNSLRFALCKRIRAGLGALFAGLVAGREMLGFLANRSKPLKASMMRQLPEGSLLAQQFQGQKIAHEDMFSITLARSEFPAADVASLLVVLLDNFVRNPPSGVTRLMRLRNTLVRPIGLRTSTLGCPVSSLLSSDRRQLFAGRFPVLAQAMEAQRAQVVLGADDKHLRFRSCVAVEMVDAQTLRFSIGTRVQCKNLFGRMYMALIHRVHLSYIVPAMLERAVSELLPVCNALEEVQPA